MATAIRAIRHYVLVIVIYDSYLLKKKFTLSLCPKIKKIIRKRLLFIKEVDHDCYLIFDRLGGAVGAYAIAMLSSRV